jgi:hypothetical protein
MTRSPDAGRDYGTLWPRVVEARFRDAQERAAVLALLAAYTGPEPDRVKLGVLKAADCNIEKMRSLLALAADDWRELLCEAEYPLSSPRWGLKEKAPEKYAALLAREQEQYEQWLESALATLKEHHGRCPRRNDLLPPPPQGRPRFNIASTLKRPDPRDAMNRKTTQ